MIVFDYKIKCFDNWYILDKKSLKILECRCKDIFRTYRHYNEWRKLNYANECLQKRCSSFSFIFKQINADCSFGNKDQRMPIKMIMLSWSN